MSYTVAALAVQVGGIVQGDDSRSISGANSLSKAGPEEIAFAGNEENFQLLPTCRAGAVLVPVSAQVALASQKTASTLIFVDDPQGAFIRLLMQFRPAQARPSLGRSPAATISATASIGENTNIHPGAFVGDRVRIGQGCDIHPGAVISHDCVIGDGCVVYPNAVLYPQVVLGNRVIIHANAVLGADGFGYRFEQGQFIKIPQLGFVQVGDDVEVGACTTIDRGAIGPTVIGAGTKLDNLVMIGHNCELGQHNAFASQVGLAGSVTTGDYVRCGGQVGIADHVHLGTNSVFGAKAGVHKDMAGGQVYLGTPVTDEHEQIKMQMAFRKLPGLLKTIRDLERQVAELSQKLTGDSDAIRAA